jgi:hypothetical protein
MRTTTALRWVFGGIFVGMLAVTGWASLSQPLWQWHGLSGPDAPWIWATLADAYAGFLTFYVWVWVRERSLGRRLGWLTAILLLGNIAMSAYVLLALARLPVDATFSDFLTRSR